MCYKILCIKSNLTFIYFSQIIFQYNNTPYLEHYWKALALSWNTNGTWISPFLECNPHNTELWLHGFAITVAMEKQR